MNILYIVPYTPSLIRVRPYNLIRELSRRGNQVTVATLWADEDERQESNQLAGISSRVETVHMPRWRSAVNCALALPTKTPLQAVYSWQPALLDRLNGASSDQDHLSNFDVVHIEHLRGSRYGLKVKSLNPNLPVIWDSVDCISLLFEMAAGRSKKLVSRMITSFELKRNRRYEGWLLGQFDHTLVTSNIDRDALLKLHEAEGERQPKLSVLPNGVDLDYFTPADESTREPDRLVVSGKMSYHANVTMVLYLVEEIMPRVWASRPSVKLYIVGKDPVPEIVALRENPNIVVTGTVDDIRPYLQKASVAVTPLSYGAGIQNKVLEAMACGTPVVSTPQAVASLNVKAGVNVLVAEQPDDYAAQVLLLLENQQYRYDVGRAGLKYVQEHHRWSAVAAQLEGIYHEEHHRQS